MAIYYGNPHMGFLCMVLGIAVGSSACVETMFFLLRLPYKSADKCVEANSKYPQIVRVARVVAIVSVVADITNAAVGGSSIFTQVTGQVAASPLASLTTPLASWKYLAVALFASACLGGLMKDSSFLKWCGLLLLGQIVVAGYTAITAPIVNYISFTIFAGLLLGLLRIKFVATFGLCLVLIWPVVFSIRNEIRESGGVAVDSDVTAQDRLRFDEQLTAASAYSVPARLPGEMRTSDILRYGLVPRVLDPGRPALSTGNLINEYMGGTRTSSYNFLAVGTVYFIEGPYGLMIFYSGWALAFVLLLRTRGGPGPVRLAVALMAIPGPLGWANTHPDALTGYLQSLLAALPVFLALRIFGRDGKTKDQ
ncbi:hypothetical protein [Actinoplanes sp. NPDC051494]|uniref:hypothetical protein n=1 Tax=Actinoplanes sp. NPDC051494 TaxID=3363907 RepID=UPI00379B77EC